MSRGISLAGSRKGTRGAATKARIVEAATRLFIEHGYLDTTVAAIANEAGVALQTLYLSFGSKVAILRATHDVAVVGDDAPIPVLDRPWVAEMRAEPKMAWDFSLQLLYQKIFPDMTHFLPEEEGARYRADFEREWRRLEAT